MPATLGDVLAGDHDPPLSLHGDGGAAFDPLAIFQAPELAGHAAGDLAGLHELLLVFFEVDGGDDLAGRAVAALQCVLVDEGLLHRMQPAVLPAQMLDRYHMAAVERAEETDAGVDALIDELAA